jgi:biopolymer transport protein ExbD
MYDCRMRTRLTLVVLIALGILGGILFRYKQSRPRPPYAQARADIHEVPIIYITITRDGALHLNGKPVSINDLVDELKRDFPTASEVYVQPDRNAVWEQVDQVLTALNAAKPPIQARFTKLIFGLKAGTQPEDSSPARRK